MVWSDTLTSFAGAFQARGGASGGDGGFAEVSSKGVLSYNGFGDLRAPAGKFGTLLLDPADFYIIPADTETPGGASVMTKQQVEDQLALGNLVIATNTAANPSEQHGDIFVNASVNWSTSSSLTLSAYRNIQFNNANLVNTPGSGAAIILRSDNTGTGTGTVNFSGDPQISTSGPVSIFYNPESYTSPTDFSQYVNGPLTAYMLVNSVADLQSIGSNLAGTYALGRNIDGDSASFAPIGSISSPFTGIFDGQYAYGQGPSISNLTIAPISSGINSIGLFAVNAGTIQNLNLTGINVTANPNAGLPGQFVGTLAGQNYGTISNVSVSGSVNGGTSQGVIAGGLVGQNGILYNNNANGASGHITDAHANVAVTLGDGVSCSGSSCNGGWNTAGGLVGSNVAGSWISYSSAEGNVTGGSSSSLGGLVGQNGFGGPFSTTSYIELSWASGNVSSPTGVNVMLGGLVGYNGPGSYIYDLSASGNVTGTGTVASCSGNSLCQFINAGGLVGQNQGVILGSGEGEGNLSYSYYAAYEGYPYGTSTYALGAVHVGQNGTAGGLVGWNDGVIAYAGASGRVTGAAGTGGITSDGSTTTLGGLAGSNQGLIIWSYATGIVGNSDVNNLQVGGLVGSNSGSILFSYAWNGYLADSYNVVGVQAGNNSQAGGLVGSNGPTNFDCGTCTWGDGHNNYGLVFASQTDSKVMVGAGSVAGGLAGSNDGIINNSVASGSVTGGADSVLGGLVGAVSIPANNLPPVSAAGDNYWSSVLSEYVSVLDLQNGVSASTASGAVTSTGPNSVVGGLVGVSGGTIADSWSSGAVGGMSESFLGGLVGINLGLVQNSSTTATRRSPALQQRRRRACWPEPRHHRSVNVGWRCVEPE